MFEYLCLMLIRHCGVRNPVTSNGILYFKTEHTHYKIQPQVDGWHLVDHTPQHNAPSIVNSDRVVRQDDWRAVLALVNPEYSPE